MQPLAGWRLALPACQERGQPAALRRPRPCGRPALPPPLPPSWPLPPHSTLSATPSPPPPPPSPLPPHPSLSVTPPCRPQVSSLELFDVSPHDLSLLDLALHVTNTTASSWDPTPLEASSATYFTKLPVSVLGLTRTARAVTAKQVLLGSVAGKQAGEAAVPGGWCCVWLAGLHCHQAAPALPWLLLHRLPPTQPPTQDHSTPACLPACRPDLHAGPAVPGPRPPPHGAQPEAAHPRAGGGGAAPLPARAAAGGDHVCHTGQARAPAAWHRHRACGAGVHEPHVCLRPG